MASIESQKVKGLPIYDFVFISIRFFDSDKENMSLNKCKIVLMSLWQNYPEAKTIIFSSQAQKRSALRFVQAGTDDYLILPFDKLELKLILEKADTLALKEAQINYLQDSFWNPESLDLMRTSCENMQEVYRKVKTVADKTANVLLTGETGVGKNIIARLIHEHSRRRENPFVAIHCGAIPENLIESELFGHEKGSFTGAIKRKIGKFELAHGGTIFLDEIGTVSSATQIKLLQILQDLVFQRVGGETNITVDVRIIAATNADLKQLVAEGQFRSDLFYRLNVFPIHIPPLRERVDDIKTLINYFADKYCRLHSKNIRHISTEIYDTLSTYNWPGNIRELENLTERACLLEEGQTLQIKSFSSEALVQPTANHVGVVDTELSLADGRQQAVDAFEKIYLQELLKSKNGKIKDIAITAQMGVRQIHKLLVKYDLLGRDYRSGKSELKDHSS